jgi:multiple sugar transport system permease protein
VFIAEHALAIALSVMFLAPIGFLLLTSFMSNDQQLTADLWPRTWHPENYANVFAARRCRPICSIPWSTRSARPR